MNDFESVFQRFSHSTEEVSGLLEEISVAPEVKRRIEDDIRSVKSEVAGCDVSIQEFTDDLILSGQYAASGKNTETRDAWLRKQIKDGIPFVTKRREDCISRLANLQGELDDVRRRVDAKMKVLGFLQSMTENATALHVMEEQMKGCEFARVAVEFLKDAKKIHCLHIDNENQLMGEMRQVLTLVPRPN